MKVMSNSNTTLLIAGSFQVYGLIMLESYYDKFSEIIIAAYKDENNGIIN